MDPFISKDVPETPSALKAEAVPFLPKMGGLGALNATSLPDKPPISTAGTNHLRGKLTTTTVKPIGTIQPPPPAGYLMMLGPAFTTDSDTDFSTSRFVAVHGLPLEWLNNGYLRQWLDAVSLTPPEFTNADMTDPVLSWSCVTQARTMQGRHAGHILLVQ